MERDEVVVDGRFVCSAATPWVGDRRTRFERVAHPDARHDGECSDGCCDYYACPHCGGRFRVEVAQ